MIHKKTPLAFFGTGQTSLDALQCLIEHFDIELVITKPPTKNSAGKLFKNPVHLWSEQNQIPVLLSESKASLILGFQGINLQSKIGVVLDYGVIIPADIINHFKLGIVNSHFSLLPKYRGANPIRSVILSGEESTGVTIIRITPELDDGPILAWSEINIGNVNAPVLREKLSQLNCALLPEAIRLYINNQIEPIEQDNTAASYTQKTLKEDGYIDPSKPALQIEREIRALAGWPKSTLKQSGKDYIIHQAKATNTPIKQGELVVENNKLLYGCLNSSLEITQIQPAGKAKMSARDFVNGYRR